MEVYIEYVIINNFVVNIMILYLTGSIRRQKVKWYRLVLSSLLGTAYAVLLPYIAFKYDFGIKIVLSFIMILIAFKIINVHVYMRTLGCFYLITFMFGGMIIGVQNVVSVDIINSLIYPNSLGVSYISIVVIIMTLISKYVVYVWRIKYNRSKYYYDVIVDCNKNKIKLRGYLDSGNKVYYKSSPVIIFDMKSFSKLDGLDYEQDYELININTINKEERVRAYRLDGIELNQKDSCKYFSNVYAIVSSRHFSDYQILLHCDM